MYAYDNKSIDLSTKEQVAEFRAATQSAAKNKEKEFSYQGTVFLTEHAQYLLSFFTKK